MGNGRALSNDLIEKPLISSLGDNTPIGSDYPVWNEFTLQGDHEPNAVFYNLRVSCINARMLNRVSGFLVSQNSKLIWSEGSA